MYIIKVNLLGILNPKYCWNQNSMLARNFSHGCINLVHIPSPSLCMMPPNQTTIFYLSHPIPSTLMLSESTHYIALQAFHLAINEPWNPLSLYYTTQGKTFLSMFTNLSRIFFPLVLLSMGRKSPIYYIIFGNCL
jgi:hypothetical protein